MLKREKSKRFYSTNADNSTTPLRCNNIESTRQMLRYNVNELRKERHHQIKNDEIVYGSPTPHDKFDAKQLIQNWSYCDNSKQIKADLIRYEKSQESIQQVSKIDIEPFRFKIGNKNQGKRLDDVEKGFAYKRAEAIFCEEDENHVRRQTMRHGHLNRYDNDASHVMKDNLVQKIENMIDNRKNPTIEDPLMEKIQSDGRVYQIFSTKLKKRIDNPKKFSNSLRKKLDEQVVNSANIKGPIPLKTFTINRYETEPEPQGNIIIIYLNRTS